MHEKDREINILGTEYNLLFRTPEEDDYLDTRDGYTDWTSRKIVIRKKSSDNQLEDFHMYRCKVIRHEIIHAFLRESGLHHEAVYAPIDGDSQPEQMIDWLAVQFPKMTKVFADLGV